MTTNLPVLNQQPPEKPDLREDGSLEVVSVFKTLQGEGPFTGHPAVFVRLAGCDLLCPACFYGGTKVWMADFKQKPISEVRVGDMVLSYSEKGKEFVKREVTEVMHRSTSVIYLVKTGNRKTFVTGEHPFLVRGRGWVQAKDLRLGDHILHLGESERMRLRNPMRILSVREKMKETTRQRGHKGPWDRMTKKQKDAFRRRASKRMTDSNPNKDPAIALKGFLNRKDRGEMTNAERFVFEIGSRFGLVFVGGGDLVVGYRVPDFVVSGTTKLIEVWDADQTRWMGRDKKWTNERRKIFADEGYEVLFLPVQPFPLGDQIGTRKLSRRKRRDAEVKRVEKELSEYVRNGETVTGLERITSSSKPKSWTALAGSLDATLTVYNMEVKGTHTYIANGMVVHNCDTNYTTGRRRFGVDELTERVAKEAGANTRLVVVTGGEPFRQNLDGLLCSLHYENLFTQVETNGTLCPSRFEKDDEYTSIVCSPKTVRIHPKMEYLVDWWKYVVEAGYTDPEDGLPLRVLGKDCRVARPFDLASSVNNGLVYIQPCDDKDPVKNKDNQDEAVRVCMKFGYVLSLQVHKIVGLD